MPCISGLRVTRYWRYPEERGIEPVPSGSVRKEPAHVQSLAREQEEKGDMIPNGGK